MKLTVKTLKGAKFDLEVEESLTVAQVKTRIVRRLSVFINEALQLLASSGSLRMSPDLRKLSFNSIFVSHMSSFFVRFTTESYIFIGGAKIGASRGVSKVDSLGESTER
jgi:hypothetical protein